MCGIAFTISQRKDTNSVIGSFKENILRRGPDSFTVEVIEVR